VVVQRNDLNQFSVPASHTTVHLPVHAPAREWWTDWPGIRKPGLLPNDLEVLVFCLGEFSLILVDDGEVLTRVVVARSLQRPFEIGFGFRVVFQPPFYPSRVVEQLQIAARAAIPLVELTCFFQLRPALFNLAQQIQGIGLVGILREYGPADLSASSRWPCFIKRKAYSSCWTVVPWFMTVDFSGLGTALTRNRSPEC
jgi:hypothetical protein